MFALICVKWVKLTSETAIIAVTGLSPTLHSNFLHFSTEPRSSEDVPQPGPQTMACLLQGVLAAQGVPVSAAPEVAPAVLR